MKDIKSRAGTTALTPEKNPCTALLSLNLLQKYPIATILKNDGMAVPSRAKIDPVRPDNLQPISREIFTAIGPGKL